MEKKDDKETLSVIIPIFNEKENIKILYESIKNTLEELKCVYEIIFVDDASTDDSFSLLEMLVASDDKLKVIQMLRNYGQTAALMAGITRSKGDIVITMDGDLQNDPRDIPRLIDKLREGYDLVSGWRKQRKDPFFTKVFPSIIANKIISSITGVHLRDYGCTLKAYRSSMLKEVKLYGEMHRFLPIYMVLEGAKITEITVNHSLRKFGKSKYGLSRIVKVILDLITVKFLTSYATKPIYIFGGIGFLLIGVGVTLGISGFIFPIAHAGLMGGLFIVMGLQLLLIGILAELIIRYHHEAAKIPIYKIRKMLNLK
jgi:glycosyltransferase involved in cell wall biosynthesis